MTTSSSSPTSGSSTPSTSSSVYMPPSSTPHDYTATEWTQQNMLTDVLQQKGLIIGVGVMLLAIFFFSKRRAPEEKAARRLVRDWRRVDDPRAVRNLLGDNLPTIMRPALLAALQEIERQTEHGFRKLEREIAHL